MAGHRAFARRVPGRGGGAGGLGLHRVPFAVPPLPPSARAPFVPHTARAAPRPPAATRPAAVPAPPPPRGAGFLLAPRQSGGAARGPATAGHGAAERPPARVDRRGTRLATVAVRGALVRVDDRRQRTEARLRDVDAADPHRHER